MGTILIAILLLVVVLVAASVVLGRSTHQVQSVGDDEYLELEGNWIRYRVAGSGAPVLLVHGWLSSSRVWEGLAARLAQRFTVYSLDLAGFGDSDKPLSGYGVRYGSRLLYAFCAHFGLTRAVVVGHDVGGAMAVKLAADHQDVVGRLVLVATPAGEDQIDLPTPLWLCTLPVVGPIFYYLGRLLRPVRELWLRAFVLDRESLTDEAVEDAGKPTAAAVAKTLSVTRREVSRRRLLRQAGIIKVPVLVVAGEEDQIVDPQATDDWASALSDAEVVILRDSGHLPMLERPEEFDARVLSFLTGDPRYLDAPADTIPEPPRTPEADYSAGDPSTMHDEDADPGEEADLRGDRPTVFRKRGGRYVPEDDPRDPEGAEEPRMLGENAEPAHGANRPAGSNGDGDGGGSDGTIPNLPEDLFEWPEPMKGARPWERPGEEQSREGRSGEPEPPLHEDPDQGDPGEDPEEPPRRP